MTGLCHSVTGQQENRQRVLNLSHCDTEAACFPPEDCSIFAICHLGEYQCTTLVSLFLPFLKHGIRSCYTYNRNAWSKQKWIMYYIYNILCTFACGSSSILFSHFVDRDICDDIVWNGFTILTYHWRKLWCNLCIVVCKYESMQSHQLMYWSRLREFLETFHSHVFVCCFVSWVPPLVGLEGYDRCTMSYV